MVGRLEELWNIPENILPKTRLEFIILFTNIWHTVQYMVKIIAPLYMQVWYRLPEGLKLVI
jgi:hypothetical protein